MPESLYKTILNSLIVFILLLSLSRIIGRKLISKMTFFDFVIGITIGSLGGSFIVKQSKDYYALLGPVIMTIAVILTGYVTLKSVPARKLIQGEPVIVIQNGKILEKNMKKLRYNSGDLMMQLRGENIFNLNEVESAILEPDGQLSVLKKSQNLPVTPKDLGLSTEYKGVSSEIIRDGKIVEQNLHQNNLTYEWLFGELTSKGINRIEDVFFANLSTDGELFIDLRNDNLDYIQKVEDDIR